MKHFLLLITGLALSATSLAGGGWTSKKGHGYFKLEERWIIANQFFDKEGNVVPITTSSIYLTNFYGEYGITDRIDIIGTVPLIARNVLNERQFTLSGRTEPGDAVTSLGDMLVGAKYGIIQDKAFVLAAGVYLGLPTGNPGGGNTMLLQTGDGEFNQLVRLEGGVSLYPLPAYATFGVGFNNRTKGFSEEFHYNAEIGYTIKEKVLVSAMIRSVSSFFNGDAPDAVNGIFSNNTEYLAYGPQVAYLYKGGKMGASLAVDYALSGKNVLARPAWSVGIFFKP
ncbi:transporter [Imperialibacter roseus]|uniref:Transporter n=1 Tax=Imperialibacter roseus TaxID=1324217 RepID=A0ABZ0ILA6_9BACT|nr:transporter [Imperialibacter roseus]WOK05306.1 transporter [Imperialibacter roseus]